MGARDKFIRVLKITIPQQDISKLKDVISKILDDGKAEDIVIIDLEGKSDIASYMVIASGNSSRHGSSLADRLIKETKLLGEQPSAIEGKSTGDWILLDFGDIIVHIFHPEVREHYNLEKMWSTPLAEVATAG